jgi:hypothetical protein
MFRAETNAVGGELRRLRRWTIAVVLVGLAERVLLWAFCEPIAYGDTPSYLRLAGQLAGFNLRGYDGTRTPGYPAFMAILGGDPRRIMLVQLILGWLISLFLLWIAWKMTGRARLAGGVALAYDLLLPLTLFETDLIAETCTTFWIIASLALLIFLSRSPRRLAALASAFALGVTASLAGLTRPLFYILAVWLLPFVWVVGDVSRRRRLARTAIFCIGPTLLLGGWLLFVYRSYDMLSPTTMGGYQLVQHTGAFFEYLPDQWADVRETYLRYRDAKIAETGVQTNAIWDAIPELTKVTGLSFYGLSNELARLSFDLIRQHPNLYTRSVIQGWVWFWKAPAYWRPEVFPSGVRAALGAWVVASRAVEVLANAAFVLISAALVVSRRLRRGVRLTREGIAVGGIVWVTSVVQTLADHGDNPRFLVPLQMVVILFVVGVVWEWARSSALMGVEEP